MPYEGLLYVRVISSTLLFGTGLGTAFHGWMAHRSRSLEAIAVVGRNVVVADWLFTTPAVIVQPVDAISDERHELGEWLAGQQPQTLKVRAARARAALYLQCGRSAGRHDRPA